MNPRKSAMTTAAASLRPTLMGSRHAVSTGHYLGTLAAMRVLDAGGNAVDAGVTAAIALAVVQPDIVSFAGVAPTLIYMEKEGRVVSLAGLIAGMMGAERAARGDREGRLRAAHDFFYRGPIAQAVAAYHAEHGGFMTAADFAGFEAPVEAPITLGWRGHEVHSCDVWCQGVTLLETLKILEDTDYARLAHNTPEYIHRVTQALDLAFSDREAYVGDPKFVQVPTATLLSDEYAARQRARIDPRPAFGAIPQPA